MKIAVTYENGQIFQHFGHTAQFKLYEIENEKILGSSIIDTNGSGHGALAGFLVSNNVSVLICGGIGGGAKQALEEAGIKLFGGVTGNADEAVNSYLSGNLGYDRMCTVAIMNRSTEVNPTPAELTAAEVISAIINKTTADTLRVCVVNLPYPCLFFSCIKYD